MKKSWIFMFHLDFPSKIIHHPCYCKWHIFMFVVSIWILRSNGLHVTVKGISRCNIHCVFQVIVGHGEPAPRLCNKDPFALKSLSYLSRIFPKAKFVLMLRDGRATVHSMISRKVCWVSFLPPHGAYVSKQCHLTSLFILSLWLHSQVTISGFDLTSYRDCLTKWSSAVETMFSQCQAAGEARCLPVRYEQLVLYTEEEMRKLLHFLELRWDPSVLHHEELIGKAGGVSLSKWVL